MKILRQLSTGVGLVLLATAGSGVAGAHGHWSEAAPVTPVNTESAEGCPIESADGLSLLIASNRPEGRGLLDIWAADRAVIGAAWTTPRNVGPEVNVDANDFCPTPVHGRWLLFVSDRTDGDVCGGGDIYLSRQSPAGGWRAPQLLGCAPHGPNFPGAERGPSLVSTSHGSYLFYSSNGDGSDHDIYVSRMRRDGSFGPGRIVRGLSSGFDDFMPNVRQRRGGWFEVVLNSNRHTWGPRNLPAFGGQDVYYAVAPHPAGPWTRPRNLGPDVNTSGEETRATLSADGKRLYFGRNGDIFMSRR